MKKAILSIFTVIGMALFSPAFADDMDGSDNSKQVGSAATQGATSHTARNVAIGLGVVAVAVVAIVLATHHSHHHHSHS